MGRGGDFMVATRMVGQNKISATNSAEKLFVVLLRFGKEMNAAQANIVLSVFYVFSMTKKYSRRLFIFARSRKREHRQV